MTVEADRILPFAIVITGNTEAVRAGLVRIMERLAPLSMAAPEREVVELVLAEVLNNIVAHAFHDAPVALPITIRCRRDVRDLHLRITDPGHPMPGGELPGGAARPTDVATADLPEGGFGWFLIRQLVRDLRYNRVGKINRLDLWVTLHP